MGLPQGLSYTEPKVNVIINGCILDISRGTKYGSLALQPLNFALVLPAYSIHQDKTVNGIKTGESEVKLGNPFSEDLDQTVPKLMDLISKFENTWDIH